MQRTRVPALYQGAEKVLSCTFSESRASARSRQINDLGRRFAADAIHGSRSECEIHVSVQQTAFSAACYDASMPLNDFDTPTAWRIDLDERWPERLAIKQAVLDRLSQHVAERESAKRPLRVLELGVGDTEMLGKVAGAFDSAELVGLDLNKQLLKHGQAALGDRATFVHQDLRLPFDHAIDTHFDIVYTFQTLHDLGGRNQLQSIYETVGTHLVPGGLLVNADFVEPMPHDDAANPRRFPASVHIEILQNLGFTDCGLYTREGAIGCIAAHKRAL